MFISQLIRNILGVRDVCRFSPTCSEYAKNQIDKNGVFVGVQRSIARILNCQPFFVLRNNI